ncbi:MAG: adenosylcobinamide amidohydrolase, partial [Methanomicrobiales archaeon]|nr:adenosylcobinamide amidohydrolase [Methanomicrobiales archaeon]
MRYYFRHETLFLRGTFRAVSTGAGGGLADVATILNHTVGYDFSSDDPVRYMAGLVAGEGLPPDFFGLLTAVRMRTLCILQHDFLTVFVTAGVEPAPAEGPGTINIVIRSEEGMTDGALCESIIVATEAKTRALHAAGYACTGTPTDAVIAACDREAPVAHRYAGPLTEAGSRLSEAVRFGVAEALKRHEGKIRTDAPSFFIFSRYGGDHWV